MTTAGISVKSKSTSIPLLQRGRQFMGARVDAWLRRQHEKQSFAETMGSNPPFVKGGQGGFALRAKGERP